MTNNSNINTNRVYTLSSIVHIDMYVIRYYQLIQIGFIMGVMHP